MKQLLNKLEKNSIIKSVINSVSKNNGICVFGLSKKEKIFINDVERCLADFIEQHPPPC